MRGFHLTTAVSALMLLATPALAGDRDRARSAIAEARGKIDAAGQVNAAAGAPEAMARAQAALRLAQEEFKSGHEQKAIRAAIDAQQFADIALGRSQQRRNTAVDGPAPVTTVTTETVKTGAAPVRTATRTTARKPVKRTTAARPVARPIVAEKTTTTVTTNN